MSISNVHPTSSLPKTDLVNHEYLKFSFNFSWKFVPSQGSVKLEYLVNSRDRIPSIVLWFIVHKTKDTRSIIVY